MNASMFLVAFACLVAVALSAPTRTERAKGEMSVTGAFHHIAVDVDFINPVRRYLIEDLKSGVNIELMFVGPVPADAAETPRDGTFATAQCTNRLPALDRTDGRYGKVKCIVPTKGFSVTKRGRRQNYAEDGRPGYTVGTRTWIVTMLQIPGGHVVTEAERLDVSFFGLFSFGVVHRSRHTKYSCFKWLKLRHPPLLVRDPYALAPSRTRVVALMHAHLVGQRSHAFTFA
jgi:hypothetical protein